MFEIYYKVHIVQSIGILIDFVLQLMCLLETR